MRKLTIRFGLLFTLLCSAALADRGKVAEDLKDFNDEDEAEVIIQFINPPTAKELAGLGKYKRDLAAGRAVVVELKSRIAKRLEDNPNVRFVSPNRKVTGAMEFASPAIYADLAFSSGWTGAGIGVAIIDSGVNLHPDFRTSTCGTATRVVYRENFVPGETSLDDGYGHGTHVASIIGGNGRCAETTMLRNFRGIAPGVNIISLRALDNRGAGTDASVIAAIDRAIALRTQFNIRVLNLSLGRGVQESHQLDPLCLAVERAWRAGIVVVVSAGNMGRFTPTQGYGTIASPGNSPFVITVGAMNDRGTALRSDDIMTTYSSKGPTLVDHIVKPDLVAPGNAIMAAQAQGRTLASLFPGNIPTRTYYTIGLGNSTTYMTLSGTSMAAPMVSGAAALLLQKTPSLTPNQVKARLMKTAFKHLPLTMQVFDNLLGQTRTLYRDAFTVGAGYLDIHAALASTDLIATPNTTPLSPAVRRDTATGRLSLVTANSLVWGSSVVWGDSMVWGDSIVWGNTVFGNSVVWGDSTVSGNSLVWGDSLVQGNSVVWGDNLRVNSVLGAGDLR